jgi:hypothetical protein
VTGSVTHTRARLLRDPAVVGAASLSAAVLLHVRDPHGAGSYGFCPFLELTGRPCPGCGGLRAVNDLTHGDVLAAVSSNVLAVVLVAGLAVAWAAWTIRRGRGVRDQMIRLDDRRLALVLVVVLAFGVVRNTPWGAWLAP